MIIKKQQNLKKRGGNVNISRETITKIILAPLFFNNDRFNKLEIVNSKTMTYYFKKDNDVVKPFLEELKNNFNDIIYQVDKAIVNNCVLREIKYKIEIINITEDYVKLIKTP